MFYVHEQRELADVQYGVLNVEESECELNELSAVEQVQYKQNNETYYDTESNDDHDYTKVFVRIEVVDLQLFEFDYRLSLPPETLAQ